MGIFKKRLIANKLTFNLNDNRGVGAGVDLNERIAFLNEVAFLEIDAHQLSVDYGFNRNRGKRRNRSEARVIYADIPFCGRDRYHLYGCRTLGSGFGRGSRFCACYRRPEKIQAHTQCKKNSQRQPQPASVVWTGVVWAGVVGTGLAGFRSLGRGGDRRRGGRGRRYRWNRFVR